MKETIVKVNKTKNWFFEKVKLTSLQPDSSRKKERRIKSTKLDEREVTRDNAEIQRIRRDYYELYGNKMDYLGKNGQVLRKVQSSKTEPGKNRNYEQLSKH